MTKLTYVENSFSWTGRQLDGISGNGNAISYKYNANGIRTEKTVNGVTTKYYIEGDRVVLEKVGNEERAFWYDGDGKAAAFVIYDSTGMHPYYYIRNGQGDVIGLFDANGTIVARYTYDSWGNLLKITDGSGNDKTNDTAFVGYKNPLRYRGYYYDSETKLYYLQSRYYNPEWGRFISADKLVTSELVGANVFAYCHNNPVMFIDPMGMAPTSYSFFGWHYMGQNDGLNRWLNRDNGDYYYEKVPNAVKIPPTINDRQTCTFNSKKASHHHVKSGHTGNDYGAFTPGVAGDPVLASTGGTVVYAGNKGDSGGNRLHIKTWDGRYELQYLHLQGYTVKVGDAVSPSQYIGYMGKTNNGKIPGMATHLHFSVVDLSTGKFIDPTTWLEG